MTIIQNKTLYSFPTKIPKKKKCIAKITHSMCIYIYIS